MLISLKKPIIFFWYFLMLVSFQIVAADLATPVGLWKSFTEWIFTAVDGQLGFFGYSIFRA